MSETFATGADAGFAEKPRTDDAGARAVAHLEPALWEKVNRLLVRKAIAEFAHEKLIEPRLVRRDDDWGHYTLDSCVSGTTYRFRARRLRLDHWSVDAASIEKHVTYVPAPLDAIAFFIEFQKALGIADGMMPIYLDEIANTLYGSAYKHATPGRSVAELLEAGYQGVEAAMMEGHPTFLANNGRIGFDADDYRRFAPEAGHPVAIEWIAVHDDHATFTSIEGFDHDALMRVELGCDLYGRFLARLRALGLDVSTYRLMPIHPWQWANRIAMSFAAEIASRRIVYLGASEDRYLAQQSIRTFFNISHPTKHYVKTSISVLNMGFMRGLSPKYMLATPAINEWLGKLVDSDPYLQAKGFSIIREVAAIGYRNPHYEDAFPFDTPYKKMLSALWRESPIDRLREGERLMTMASLLHVDPDGKAFVSALIAASRLDARTWIAHYLDAYLAPLIHCFYTYDLAFMPHGENLILVIEDHVPQRVIMKDIGEEIGILNGTVELPEAISRIAFKVDDAQKLNCIFTDVFDCFFRYLAALLDEHGALSAPEFWQLVADCVRRYQDDHPELIAKYRQHDLFKPQFTRNCLNRLQLADNQQMLNLADPEKSLQFIGTLDNPIAEFAHRRSTEDEAHKRRPTAA